MTDVGVDLTGIRLDLLKQLSPRLKRIAVLGDPASTLWEPTWRETQTAARQLGIQVAPVLVSTPDQLDPVFTNLHRAFDAVFVAPLPVFWVHRRRIIQLSAKAKLPAIYEWRTFPEDGGLMSYGVDYVALNRRAARLVDRVLKGVKPADIPVE